MAERSRPTSIWVETPNGRRPLNAMLSDSGLTANVKPTFLELDTPFSGEILVRGGAFLVLDNIVLRRPHLAMREPEPIEKAAVDDPNRSRFYVDVSGISDDTRTRLQDWVKRRGFKVDWLAKIITSVDDPGAQTETPAAAEGDNRMTDTDTNHLKTINITFSFGDKGKWHTLPLHVRVKQGQLQLFVETEQAPKKPIKAGVQLIVRFGDDEDDEFRAVTGELRTWEDGGRSIAGFSLVPTDELSDRHRVAVTGWAKDEQQPEIIGFELPKELFYVGLTYGRGVAVSDHYPARISDDGEHVEVLMHDRAPGNESETWTIIVGDTPFSGIVSWRDEDADPMIMRLRFDNLSNARRKALERAISGMGATLMLPRIQPPPAPPASTPPPPKAEQPAPAGSELPSMPPAPELPPVDDDSITESAVRMGGAPAEVTDDQFRRVPPTEPPSEPEVLVENGVRSGGSPAEVTAPGARPESLVNMAAQSRADATGFVDVSALRAEREPLHEPMPPPPVPEPTPTPDVIATAPADDDEQTEAEPDLDHTMLPHQVAEVRARVLDDDDDVVTEEGELSGAETDDGEEPPLVTVLPEAPAVEGGPGFVLDVFLTRAFESEHRYSGDEPLTIGRWDDNRLQLPMSNVSKHHLVIKRGDAGFEVEDLRSSNGTFVNGKRAKKAVPLADGDCIQVGNYHLMFWQTDDIGTWEPKRFPVLVGQLGQTPHAKGEAALVSGQLWVFLGDEVNVVPEGLVSLQIQKDGTKVNTKWLMERMKVGSSDKHGFELYPENSHSGMIMERALADLGYGMYQDPDRKEAAQPARLSVRMELPSLGADGEQEEELELMNNDQPIPLDSDGNIEMPRQKSIAGDWRQHSTKKIVAPGVDLVMAALGVLASYLVFGSPAFTLGLLIVFAIVLISIYVMKRSARKAKLLLNDFVGQEPPEQMLLKMPIMDQVAKIRRLDKIDYVHARVWQLIFDRWLVALGGLAALVVVIFAGSFALDGVFMAKAQITGEKVEPFAPTKFVVDTIWGTGSVEIDVKKPEPPPAPKVDKAKVAANDTGAEPTAPPPDEQPAAKPAPTPKPAETLPPPLPAKPEEAKDCLDARHSKDNQRACCWKLPTADIKVIKGCVDQIKVEE